ncbi:MAG: 3-dehydroquinate synthase [Alphaproteobacteria bacterium]|nr:MAG: 3-dehydroquinate synthase [Alphaproteobacteria bacterium]
MKPAEGQEQAGPPVATRVPVSLGPRSYEIAIGHGLLPALDRLLPADIRHGRLAVVADARVAGLFGPILREALARLACPVTYLEVPPGEASKNFRMLERICSQLLEAGIARDDHVLAFGGGMVGDLAGLAAALVRRGVGLVQIPTTLLAQVDSAVGGKTAINMPAGKNLVGSFHQPRLVISDLDLLATLPARERRAGLAEVAKYGLIADESFWAWLTGGGLAAMDAGKKEALLHGIATSCRIKADIVAADEREESGRRFLLNLGHSFAHALEKAVRYDSARLLHGEAVAVGLVLAAELSAALGHAEPVLAEEVAGALAAIGLPTTIAQAFGDDRPTAAGLMAAMGQDKKIRAGRLRFVLLERPGRAFVTAEVDPQRVAAILVRSGARQG